MLRDTARSTGCSLPEVVRDEGFREASTGRATGRWQDGATRESEQHGDSVPVAGIGSNRFWGATARGVWPRFSDPSHFLWFDWPHQGGRSTPDPVPISWTRGDLVTDVVNTDRDIRLRAPRVGGPQLQPRLPGLFDTASGSVLRDVERSRVHRLPGRRRLAQLRAQRPRHAGGAGGAPVPRRDHPQPRPVLRGQARASWSPSSRHVLAPRHLAYQVQFTGPTGANAVEAALKLARKVTGRTNVIAFTNAFHGVSLGALAATGNSHHRMGPGGPADHGVTADAVRRLRRQAWTAPPCSSSCSPTPPAASTPPRRSCWRRCRARVG